jgi:hypothetical protein
VTARSIAEVPAPRLVCAPRCAYVRNSAAAALKKLKTPTKRADPTIDQKTGEWLGPDASRSACCVRRSFAHLRTSALAGAAQRVVRRFRLDDSFRQLKGPAQRERSPLQNGNRQHDLGRLEDGLREGLRSLPSRPLVAIANVLDDFP